MSLKVILLIAVPMFVICCAILLKYWDRFKKPPKQQRSHHKIEKVPETAITICPDKMSSDNQNEAEEKMAKAIFISAICWFSVFDLLSPRQLGFGIAMISHRFDFYVDVHFKMRRWSLKSMEILPKFKVTYAGTMGVKMVNVNWKSFEITQKARPKRVVGFEPITIRYINDNGINTNSDRILESIFRNIWPMVVKHICAMELSAEVFHRLRHFVPSFLNDCPSLRLINAYDYGFFTEFPCDDSANASNGQAVAKWLFTPLKNDVPKVFKCWLHWDDGHFASRIEDFKSAFTNASSPVNFIAIIRFPTPFADSVMPFDLTNELTQEQLTLKRMMIDIGRFLLIVVQLSEMKANGQNGKKKRLTGNFMINGTELTFVFRDAMIGPK